MTDLMSIVVRGLTGQAVPVESRNITKQAREAVHEVAHLSQETRLLLDRFMSLGPKKAITVKEISELTGRVIDAEDLRHLVAAMSVTVDRMELARKSTEPKATITWPRRRRH